MDVAEYHEHAARARALASYLGLALVALAWLPRRAVGAASLLLAALLVAGCADDGGIPWPEASPGAQAE